MKNFLIKLFVSAFAIAPLAVALPAQAALMPQWDVTGHYTFGFVLGGTYVHDVDLVEDSSGNITGTGGGYPAGGPYVYTWVIDSGSVVGSTINFTAHYTASADAVTPLTVMHVTGTIYADGTMSGDWDDNYQGGNRIGTWSTASGTANVTSVTNWGSELSPASCVGKVGNPVVNVTEKVTNDVDSGLAGNWAIDNYNRHIQVWRVGNKTSTNYCALVTYEGKADAQAGATGPGGGSGVVGEGVTAEMKGGYRATFSYTGTLNLSGSTFTRAKGSVGTVDYGCDISGAQCTYQSWLDQYFPESTGFSQPWWGWFYYAGDHGSWLNSSDGTLGNIL